jgi:hypothetical protein
MYKFIVSCYYWPVAKNGLRLKALTVVEDCEKPRANVEGLPVGKRPRLYELTVERRQTPRFRARCEAELAANLAILDADETETTQSLIFFGETLDLSAAGISLVLPSTQIDERFCDGSQRLLIQLYLPRAVVELEVSFVRCIPLNASNLNKGFVLGGKITQIQANKSEFDRYLSTSFGLSNV